MYIYTPGFDKYNEKLSQMTGYKFSTDYTGEPPAATLIVRRTKLGGIDEPAQHITDPKTTLVLAGQENDKSFEFAEKVVDLGVPEENILFVPKGKGISLNLLAERLLELAQKLQTHESEDLVWIEDEETQPSPNTTTVKTRIKVLAVMGFRGGTGRTTIATSLAAHYSDIGEKVAYVDLGSPAAAAKHTDVQMEEKQNLLFGQTFFDIYSPSGPFWQYPLDELKELIKELRAKYRRVIIDLPVEITEDFLGEINPDRIITVMDADIVQSVEPAAAFRDAALFVYNKAIPQVDGELISAFVGSPLIIIKNDYDGCQAALASREPAYRKSGEVAQGIGELAAELQG